MKKILVVILSLFVYGVLPGMAQEEKLVFTYPVGSLTVTLLSEMQRDGKAEILIGATPEMLQEYMPDGVYPNAVNVFLVETGGKTILVDAGYGTRLFTNLAAVGKSVADIDVVLLTHMHGDHIGGLLRDGVKSFPNAELYVSQKEHDYWTNTKLMQEQPENRRGGFVNAQEVIEKYKDKLHLFVPGEAGSSGEILSGVEPVAAYGHTPGHTGYLFTGGERPVFIWGDFVNCMPIQVPFPEVATVYDVDPILASETRKQLLKYLTENNIRIGGMHIEYPGIGDVTGTASSRYVFALLPTNN